MKNEKYNIQELLQRDVYVNDKKVGTIVGERHHPNEARVRSMRIQVESDVADEYMRKPAELAPLPKELVCTASAMTALSSYPSRCVNCSEDGETQLELMKSCMHPTKCLIEQF